MTDVIAVVKVGECVLREVLRIVRVQQGRVFRREVTVERFFLVTGASVLWGKILPLAIKL